MFFLREVSLSAGPLIIGVGALNLRINFDIQKDLSSNITTSEISIYNLSERNRNILRDLNEPIELRGGYEFKDGPKTIIIAEISQIHHKSALPDLITTLEVSSSFAALRQTRESISFKAGTSASNILNTLANKFNLTIRPLDFSLDGEYISGFSVSGTAREALDKVTNRFDLEWSIQNNEIQILQKDRPTVNTPVIISYDNGLLSKPERLRETKDRLTGELKPPGFTIETFLNPDIEPGNLAIMQDGPAPGNYRVESVSHNGDNKEGNFKTTAEIFEV